MNSLSHTWPNPNAWDPTRLRDLMLCFSRFWYRHMLALEAGLDEPEFAVHLEWGRAYHAALARYELEKLRLRRKPGWEAVAVRAALAVALDQSRGWPQWAPSTKLLEARGLLGEKNQLTLLRAVCWYHFTIGHEDPCETLLIDGKPALELQIKVPFPGLPGEILCSNVDRVVKYGGGNWIVERKSTKGALGSSYWHRFDPDIQIDIYCAIGRLGLPKLDIQGVILDAMQTGVEFCRPGRDFKTRTLAQSQETLAAVADRIRQFRSLQKGGLPSSDLSLHMNSAACQAGGGPCSSRRICAVDAADRARQIATYFHTRKNPWNPLEFRDID